MGGSDVGRLHGDAGPDHLAQTLVEKSEGNPFFLEELSRAVIEYGDLQGDVTVPDTIQGVLSARIDRLPETTQTLAPDRIRVGT